MGISKFYHLTMKEMEDAEWQRLLRMGQKLNLEEPILPFVTGLV